MSNSALNALNALIDASEAVQKQKRIDLGVNDIFVPHLRTVVKELDIHIERMESGYDNMVSLDNPVVMMLCTYHTARDALKDAKIPVAEAVRWLTKCLDLTEHALQEDSEYVRAQYTTGVLGGLRDIFNTVNSGTPIAFVPGDAGKYARTVDFIHGARGRMPTGSDEAALAETLPPELLEAIKAIQNVPCTITLNFTSSWRPMTTKAEFTLVSTVVSWGGSSYAGPVVGYPEPAQIAKHVAAYGEGAKTTFDEAGKYLKEFQLVRDGVAFFGSGAAFPKPNQ